MDYDPGETSVRRNLIKQFYASCNFNDWADVKKLLKVFEVVLIKIQTEQNRYFQNELDQQYERLINFLRRDDFIFENNRLQKAGGKLSLDAIASHADELNANNLHLQIRRIEAAIDHDPDLAIGTAKELVETTCKTILQELDRPVGDNWDMMKLVKETRNALKLAPDDIPEAAKASRTIKILLSNLATITQGIAELRNSYGTGHGKEGRRSGLKPRHARLAVGSATTLATFLFDTYSERES